MGDKKFCGGAFFEGVLGDSVGVSVSGVVRMRRENLSKLTLALTQLRFLRCILLGFVVLYTGK